MGVVRAFQDAGPRVPLAVSVPGAACHTPLPTTAGRPLRKTGMIAAETPLQPLDRETEKSAEFIEVEPDRIVREATGPAPVAKGKRSR